MSFGKTLIHISHSPPTCKWDPGNNLMGKYNLQGPQEEQQWCWWGFSLSINFLYYICYDYHSWIIILLLLFFFLLLLLLLFAILNESSLYSPVYNGHIVYLVYKYPLWYRSYFSHGTIKKRGKMATYLSRGGSSHRPSSVRHVWIVWNRWPAREPICTSWHTSST